MQNDASRQINLELLSAMSGAALATARFCVQSLPSAAAAILTAYLAPFGAPVAAGLSALVGACAWAKALQRRSTLFPQPDRFIGS